MFLISLLLLFYFFSSSSSYCIFQQISYRKWNKYKSCFSLKQASLRQPSHESDERSWLELTHSLDLKPLLQAISRYCKTFHGQQAILSLIGESNGAYSRRSKNTSVEPSKLIDLIKRNERESPSKKSLFPAFAHLPTFAIIQVAESADAARQEYKLVQEALGLLQNSTIYHNIQRCLVDTDFHDDVCHDAHDLMPPIYTVKHGRGHILEENEEDFRWLTFDGSLARMENNKQGTKDSLDLVDILYAEQSIKKILSLRNWTLNNATRQAAPGIFHFLTQTLMNKEISSSITAVWDRISNSVEIVTTPKSGALTGKKEEENNFILKLSSAKFPLINILEEKERKILQEVELEKKLAVINKSRFDKNCFHIMKNIPNEVFFLVQGVGITTLGSSYDGMFLDLIVPSIKVQELISDLTQTLNQKKYLEKDILGQLQTSINQYKHQIQYALNIVARIDTLLARAFYGYQYSGIFPQHIYHEGCIYIKNFVHPVLALLEEKPSEVVPIDLELMDNSSANNNATKPALIISGANGGGKTLALKSFGLCATLCKLGIPIPVDKTNTGECNEVTRIDYFEDVFIDLGDSQSVSTGYSTLMAKLNTCSQIIKCIEDGDSSFVDEEGNCSKCFLVLLDELGSGTDPESGSAIARAILEHLIEPKVSSICKVIATTHSPQLKLLPLIDHRFRSASVLLQDSGVTPTTGISGAGTTLYTPSVDLHKLPSYKLAYDVSGDSYMLGAASRCQPPLPRKVIERAADYCLNSTNTLSSIRNASKPWTGSRVLSMQESIMMDREAAAKARYDAEDELREIQCLREATMRMTQKFECQLRRIEYRFTELMTQIREDSANNGTYEILGDSLETIRLSKKSVSNAADVLAKKGLRLVPPSYKLSKGEIVVVIAQGDWEGETVVIKQVCEETGDIILEPTMGWGGGLAFPESVIPFNMSDLRIITLKRTEIALWDYSLNPLDDLSNTDYSKTEEKSSLRSEEKLLSVLSKLSSNTTPKKMLVVNSKSHGSSFGKFTSARERKLSKAEERKRKKGKPKNK